MEKSLNIFWPRAKRSTGSCTATIRRHPTWQPL